MKYPALSAALILALSLKTVSGQSLRESIDRDYQENLKDLFIHFHQNPELSFREFETAKRMAQEFRILGYKVTKGVGQTGVVAVLKNGEGPTVMIRADMDGLPVRENSGLSYASTKRQEDMYGVEQHVMHACGHDVHITSLLGTAKQLMNRKDRWSGTLVLICQPAEERVAGAQAMLKDGLYNRFPKPDYALALHVASGIPLGKIVIYPNSAYSGADSVDIVVHGVAGHGAAPHRSIDPVLVASQIVVSLQTIVSRTLNPLEPGVITVGSIHGGTKHNIISDRVEMQITVRSDNFETRKALLDGIDRVAEGVARSLGVPDNLLPEVVRSELESTPPTINDEKAANLLRGVFEEQLPAGTVIDWPRGGMGAEDFAYLVHPDHGVKGVYFRIGGTATESTDDAPPHHSPLFRIKPEAPIKIETEAMVVAAEHLMRKH